MSEPPTSSSSSNMTHKGRTHSTALHYKIFTIAYIYIYIYIYMCVYIYIIFITYIYIYMYPCIYNLLYIYTACIYIHMRECYLILVWRIWHECTPSAAHHITPAGSLPHGDSLVRSTLSQLRNISLG